MDTRNVIAAISLSAAVIILYGLFFAPDPKPINQVSDEKNTIVQDSDAPKLEIKEIENQLSREELINKFERVKFENENIKGSISLEGAVLDDLIFKKYTDLSLHFIKACDKFGARTVNLFIFFRTLW